MLFWGCPVYWDNGKLKQFNVSKIKLTGCDFRSNDAMQVGCQPGLIGSIDITNASVPPDPDCVFDRRVFLLQRRKPILPPLSENKLKTVKLEVVKIDFGMRCPIM